MKKLILGMTLIVLTGCPKPPGPKTIPDSKCKDTAKTTCYDNKVLVCDGHHWQILRDCSKTNSICEDVDNVASCSFKEGNK